MPIDRTKFNALIDYDGTNPMTATLWNKQQIKDVILDPIDAELIAPDTVTVAAAGPRITLNDTGAPADLRQFQILDNAQVLQFRALNDAGTAQVPVPLTLNRGGDVLVGRDLYEKGRALPMGHWQTVPFNAANFTASPGTWTVNSAALIENVYTLIGNTMIWSLYISWFTGTSTVAGSPTSLRIQPPVTVAAAINSAARVGIAYVNGVVTDMYFSPGNPLVLATLSGAAMTGTVGFIGQVVFRIA